MDPNKEEKTLSVGFLNIYGQTNFNQAKVNQIEFLVKTNKIDILHLQETNIVEETFENSNYLKNNYQILFQNNESGFGVCSLINNELETKNVLLHPSGRLISFDVEDFTMINVYLQSGNNQIARNQREEFSGKILPNILLNSKKKEFAEEIGTRSFNKKTAHTFRRQKCHQVSKDWWPCTSGKIVSGRCIQRIRCIPMYTTDKIEKD